MMFSIFIFVSVALAALVIQGASHPLNNGTIAEVDQIQTIDGRQQNHRIIGGWYAVHGEIPYILSLQHEGQHFCGASLLWDDRNKRNYAITAAHCVEDGVTSGLTVAAGSLFIYGNSFTKQEVGIRKIVIHPNYLPDELRNDIAILFLSDNFHHNYYVHPISLPSSIVQPGEKVLVSGWGSTALGSPYSAGLQSVEVPVVGNDDCANMYSEIAGNEQVIFDSNVCAGEREGGKDTCRGDNGGPLAVEDLFGAKLIGISSWRYKCALPNFPGVYTRVSFYVDWIKYALSYN